MEKTEVLNNLVKLKLLTEHSNDVLFNQAATTFLDDWYEELSDCDGIVLDLATQSMCNEIDKSIQHCYCFDQYLEQCQKDYFGRLYSLMTQIYPDKTWQSSKYFS